MIFCIDAGHGGHDPGASFAGVREADVTLAIAKHVADELWALGHGVVLTRPGSLFVSLRKRVQIANDARCHAFVSIHANADADDDTAGDPEARGVEVWISEGSERGGALAVSIIRMMAAGFPGEPMRGVKETTGLYVLNHTALATPTKPMIPAALVEVGFIDARETVAKLLDMDYRKRLGQAIADGCDAWAKA